MPAETLHFKRTKETKGTVIFEQVNEDGTEHFAPAIKTMYVAKSSPLLMGGKTTRLKAVIECLE